MLVRPTSYGKPLNPSLGLSSKITQVSQVSPKDEEKKNFYTNLAVNLFNKLLHAPNKFDLDSIFVYYKRFLNTENEKFTFLPTSEDEILKLLKDTNPEKSSWYR